MLLLMTMATTTKLWLSRYRLTCLATWHIHRWYVAPACSWIRGLWAVGRRCM